MKCEDYVFKKIHTNERTRRAGNTIFSTRRLLKQTKETDFWTRAVYHANPFDKRFSCDIQRTKNFKERLTRVHFRYFDKNLTTDTFAHGVYHVYAMNAEI